MRMYKYFSDCQTLEDVKIQYHRLMKEFHPDLNPKEKEAECTEISKEINNEFEIAYKEFQNIHRNFNDEIYEREYKEMDFAAFQDIIWKLLKMADDCFVELIGCYIWVSNKVENGTKIHKDELKDMGFKWHSKRKMWYLTREDKKAWHSNASIDVLREKYGSTLLESNTVKGSITVV